jgi:hypothetical protein
MKKLIGITVTILLTSSLLFVAVCVGEDIVTKHVKGTWNGIGYTMSQGFCPDGSLQSISIGNGVMTLTGKSEWYSIGCLDITSGRFDGYAIITAATGGKLFLGLTMWLYPTGEYFQENTVTGGTGIFYGVTGGGTSTGTYKFTAPGSPMDVWEGTNEGYFTFDK